MSVVKSGVEIPPAVASEDCSTASRCLWMVRGDYGGMSCDMSLQNVDLLAQNVLLQLITDAIGIQRWETRGMVCIDVVEQLVDGLKDTASVMTVGAGHSICRGCFSRLCLSAQGIRPSGRFDMRGHVGDDSSGGLISRGYVDKEGDG